MQNKITFNNNWKESVVTIALEYANYIWIPTDKNTFHGYDTEGILVNTPDFNYKFTI